MTAVDDFSPEQVDALALLLDARRERIATQNRDLEARLAEAREKAGHVEERRAEGYGMLQETLMARKKARMEQE